MQPQESRSPTIYKVSAVLPRREAVHCRVLAREMGISTSYLTHLALAHLRREIYALTPQERLEWFKPRLDPSEYVKLLAGYQAANATLDEDPPPF